MFINKPLTSPEQMLFESQDEALSRELASFIRFCIGLPIFHGNSGIPEIIRKLITNLLSFCYSRSVVYQSSLKRYWHIFNMSFPRNKYEGPYPLNCRKNWIMRILPTWAFMMWLNKCHATDCILHRDLRHSNYMPASEDCKTRIQGLVWEYMFENGCLHSCNTE